MRSLCLFSVRKVTINPAKWQIQIRLDSTYVKQSVLQISG